MTTTIDRGEVADAIARAIDDPDITSNNIRSITFHPRGFTIELFTGEYDDEPLLAAPGDDDTETFTTSFTRLEILATRTYRIDPA